MRHLVFEFPEVFYVGLPLGLALLGMFGYRCYRRGLPAAQWMTSIGLRATALAILVFLAARPVWLDQQSPDPPRRDVCLLLDRSASMSLEEGGQTRYAEALEFVRDELLPGARKADLRVHAYLFADDATAAEGPQLEAAQPDGPRTNLARGVLHALASMPDPPAAVVALTDGVITDSDDNTSALSALLRSGVPFVAVGFGREVTPHSLTLLSLTAPPIVPPEQPFHLSVQLEATGTAPTPPFDLLLMRDGQLIDQKTVSPPTAARHWQESFEVRERVEGLRSYTVRLQPPDVAGLHAPRTQASTNVRIGREDDLRVLFVQRALTWDYKFIRLALQDDPHIKLAGVTQTAQQSILHQTVDESDVAGVEFPASLDELSKYRVLVLSNFRAEDLSPEQQQMVETFCAEMGGGVLLIGGPDTLDAAWNTAPLGRLLPVRLAAAPRGQGGASPFRLQLAPAALSHPVFRITDSASQAAAWSSLPPFTHAAAIESAKPAAQVWGVHSSRRGADGQPAILIAQQRFGAGVSAVIGVQTFWRWRLARDSDPETFDRFWRQLLRFLAEAGRQEVLVRLPDQELAPGAVIRLLVERSADPTAEPDARTFNIRIEDPHKRLVSELSVELPPGGEAPIEFRASDAGMYQVSVLSADQPLAFRSVEIREGNPELDRPGRDMETLRQWASLTGGVAVKAEECHDAAALFEKVRRHIEATDLDRIASRASPLGISWPVMLMLLGLIGAEWALRKRWDWP